MADHTLNVLSRHNSNPLIFNSLNVRSQDVEIFLFSDSLIASHTCSSHIHLNNTSRHLISTSTFIIIIVTTTKAGDCYSIHLSIPYAIFHQANIKIYSLKGLPPNFPSIYVHYFYSIANSKSPLCPKYLIG